MTKLAVN